MLTVGCASSATPLAHTQSVSVSGVVGPCRVLSARLILVVAPGQRNPSRSVTNSIPAQLEPAPSTWGPVLPQRMERPL